MFHLLLLIKLLLLLVIYDGLVGLKVFTYSLIDCLLSNFVIIAGLDVNHVFQIIYVATVELRILRIGATATASELIVYVDASIALTLA